MDIKIIHNQTGRAEVPRIDRRHRQKDRMHCADDLAALKPEQPLLPEGRVFCLEIAANALRDPLLGIGGQRPQGRILRMALLCRAQQ